MLYRVISEVLEGSCDFKFPEALINWRLIFAYFIKK